MRATIGAIQFHATEMAARSAGVVLQSLPIRRPEDVNETFQHAVREQAHAMVILSSPLIFGERGRIADLALKAKLPTISLFNSFPSVGGLLAYGPDFPSIFRQAAGYVSRILEGAFLRAQNPPNYLFSDQPSSNWWSIRRPLRRSALRCRKRCWFAPIR